MLQIRGKKGQSMLEGVILLVAIVAAIVLVLTTTFQKSNSAGLGKLMFKSSEKIVTESAKIANMVP